MTESIIKFENFGFKYNAQAEPTLYGINLDIHRGEKILIAGPSGCGKSTLAHTINGLIPASYRGEISGRLTIAGRDSSELGIFDISKTVGTVLQDSDGQFIGLTVAEDIAFALENDCVGEPELHRRVADIARVVSIESHLKHAPGELSGGQKQRVSLAGVMVDDVDVLLFDEPLANLDPETGRNAIELIDRIQRETGKTVIIIEHRLEDVLHRPVDRIILMEEGRIAADMTPDELLSTGLLEEKGIREPLYLTALKYAGVDIYPEMHPASVDGIFLSDEDRKKVRDWFVSRPIPEKKAPKESLLSVDGLSFSYHSDKSEAGTFKALKNISLDIHRGEIMAIVGRNGAGKSTFSKVICGFEKQQNGSVCFNGQDIRELSIKERADLMGYVMQNPNQMISQTMIRDEVGLGLNTRGVPREEADRRVEETLKICGLYPFRSWPVSALSYGQKKRVTIASILALKPELIILDEPTAGQDYRHYTEIMEFLTELNREGITVVMITHDMHLMLEYAHRSVVFAEGRIIADGTGAEILTDPETVARASLKETSLYELAVRCGIEDGTAFVQRFIDFEAERRAGK